jgi:trans-aconitate 2-methyltransferase
VWNVAQYEKFGDERSRPFFDLLARVPDRPCRRIVDLGAGTGELTRTLCDRWPEASVVGVDNSESMLAAARSRAIPGRLEFVLHDLATFTAEPFELVVSNAALHWVDDHERALARLRGLLTSGGRLAIQMPRNFDQPSHTILSDLVTPLLPNYRLRSVAEPEWYFAKLAKLGFVSEIWETTYLHVLQGDDAVFEWTKGTALVPVLKALPDDAKAAFTESYRRQLREAYPKTELGTLFPFKRIFIVARVT